MTWLRPDFESSIFMQGVIDQSMVDRLTPRIMELRFSKKAFEHVEPRVPSITMFIDSPGGSPALAWRLLDLIRSPGQDGVSRSAVAYVTGRAASAAADFTIQADYSYMELGASMLCHGTSLGDNTSLNAQKAQQIAASLQQDNEFYARQLASASFKRLLFRFTTMDEAFVNFVHEPINGLAGLVEVLKKKLASEALRELVGDSLRQQSQIDQLSKAVYETLKSQPPANTVSEKETAIFQAILGQRASDKNWLLSRGGLEEVSADFWSLQDYYTTQSGSIRQLASQYKDICLTEDERHHAATFAWANAEAKNLWEMDHATPRIRSLWYFAISLARLLQGKDYEFGALDAYWLGLVDEVVGEELPCMRLLMEAKPDSSQS